MPQEQGGYRPEGEEFVTIPGSPEERAKKDPLLSAERRKLTMKQKVSLALLAIASAAGIKVLTEQSETPIEPARLHIEADRVHNIEIPSLKPGKDIQFYEGTVTVDGKKVHFRSSPHYDHDSADGDRNQLDLALDKITIANPVFAGNDQNGAWAEAVDRTGREIYFNIEQSGSITDATTGEPIDLAASGLHEARVTAATDHGVTAMPEDSDANVLVGTIIDATD